MSRQNFLNQVDQVSTTEELNQCLITLVAVAKEKLQNRGDADLTVLMEGLKQELKQLINHVFDELSLEDESNVSN